MIVNKISKSLIIFPGVMFLTIQMVIAQKAKVSKSSSILITAAQDIDSVSISFKNNSSGAICIFSSYFDYWSYSTCLVKSADTLNSTIFYDLTPRIPFLTFDRRLLSDRSILTDKRILLYGQIPFEYIKLEPNRDTVVSFSRSVLRSTEKFTNENGDDCSTAYRESTFTRIEMKFSYFKEKNLNNKKKVKSKESYRSVCTEFSY
jgi:hypothetical protein